MSTRSPRFPSQLILLGLALAGAVAVAGLGTMAWRSLRRLDDIASQAGQAGELERARDGLRALELAQAEGARVEPAALADVRAQIDAVLADAAHLDPETRSRLADVAEQIGAGDARGLADAASRLDTIVEDASHGQRVRVARLRGDVQGELEFVAALSLVLVALGALGAWTFQRHIARPLADLQRMFDRLSRSQFATVPMAGVHPVLAPLFENYNRLVERLRELELERARRAESLESEVRLASRALLEQQRTLARAERLAAVGEVAATLAHEMRNPLAGVLMALSNLRRDLDDPELQERLALATAELERITRLLNDHLSAARHEPEPARPLALRRLTEELLTLIRHQVPRRVELVDEVDPELTCTLPRDRVRQALLNLVLNSTQALGESGGHVVVRAAREGERVVIEVLDDGPGFPPSRLDHAGQAFASHRRGGTGLGLAMVRRLALDLGGALHLSNREPRGARVRLELPAGHA